jgi:hypothetical protein
VHWTGLKQEAKVLRTQVSGLQWVPGPGEAVELASRRSGIAALGCCRGMR